MRNLGALVLFATLTACGGDSDGPLTVEQLAEEAGCSGFTATPDVVMVREAGECSIDGADAYLYTFSDTEQRDAAPTEAGGGIVVEGDLWQVQVFDQATAEQVASATGGEVQ